MFGCVSGKQKALWHFIKGGRRDEFCGLLIDIYRYLNPALTIIDAVTAMDAAARFYLKRLILFADLVDVKPIEVQSN
jgi:hypothetical protein